MSIKYYVGFGLAVLVGISIVAGSIFIGLNINKSNDLDKIIGTWEAKLYKSTYRFDFQDNKILNIETNTSQDGFDLTYYMQMDFEHEKVNRSKFIKTYNHSVTSEIEANEDEIFQDFPTEYMENTSDEKKQKYIDDLKKQLEGYNLGEVYQSAITSNPNINYVLQNEDNTLLLGTFLTKDKSLALQRV